MPTAPTRWATADGDVAWVADRPAVRMPDGTEVPLRSLRSRGAVVGVDEDVAAPLVERTAVRLLLDDLRPTGELGLEVPVPVAPSAVHRLLGSTGRRP